MTRHVVVVPLLFNILNLLNFRTLFPHRPWFFFWDRRVIIFHEVLVRIEVKRWGIHELNRRAIRYMTVVIGI
jgi:hypothetical protein